MSEEPNTRGQNEDPAVPMNPGPTGEASSAEFQRQPNGANPNVAPQNDDAAPEMGSQAAPVEQTIPGEISNVNTPGSVADEQSEPTALVLLPGQAEVESHQHAAPVLAASSPRTRWTSFQRHPSTALPRSFLTQWR